MSKRLEVETELPKFSALQRCLVVDSRHSSRIEILKDIKASELFEEVIEGSSLSNALQKIKSISFDACFTGPSISIDRVTQFISQAKDVSLVDDCAFIAVVAEDCKIESDLLLAAHHVIPFPIKNKKFFFEETVKAILMANKGTVWPGMRLGEDGLVEFFNGSTWQKFEFNNEIKVQGANSPDASLPKNFKLLPEEAAIEDFCARIGNTPKSRIENIIQELILNSQGESADPFAIHFLKAIQEWRSDLEFCTAKEAGITLRKNLLAYTQNKK